MGALDTGMDYIMDSFSGWLYTVREPLRYLGNKHPRIEWADSDKESHFCSNGLKMRPNITLGNTNRHYDMMFINFNYSEWHDNTKNWTLATKVFEKVLEAFPDFKILLIGRLPPKHLEHY